MGARSNGVKCTAWFKFGNNNTKEKQQGFQDHTCREDYEEIDIEHYFNYTGKLADLGTYDVMDDVKKLGLAPIDIILLWACEEGDTEKVEELLGAGADVTVKNLEGKTPLQLAKKPEIISLLKEIGATV